MDFEIVGAEGEDVFEFFSGIFEAGSKIVNDSVRMVGTLFVWSSAGKCL